MARKNYKGAKLLMHWKAKTPDLDLELVSHLHPIKVVDDGNVWKFLKGYETRRHAGSEFLLDLLKRECSLITLTAEETQELFDDLEFLISLEFAHFRLAQPNVNFWMPEGPYLWRRQAMERRTSWLQGSIEGLIKAGFLGGDRAKAEATMTAVQAHLKKIPNY